MSELDGTSPESSRHDRADGTVVALEEQRAQLEADVADAQTRLAAAQRRRAELDARTKEALRRELTESRDRLAELEAEHAARVERIREGAAAEIADVLGAARRRAADIEARSGTVS